MHRDLVAVFNRFDRLIDVRKIEFGVNALCVHVEGKGDEVDIAGTLAITKETALNTVSASH